jgi:hypothetical protein
MKARSNECVEIALFDPDATAPALATEAVMLEQPLRAPFVDQRIRYANAIGNLFWSEQITTYLSIPAADTPASREAAMGSRAVSIRGVSG